MDQPAAATRLTLTNLTRGMSSMPAISGSSGRSGPMKRPTSRLATPYLWMKPSAEPIHSGWVRRPGRRRMPSWKRRPMK